MTYDSYDIDTLLSRHGDKARRLLRPELRSLDFIGSKRLKCILSLRCSVAGECPLYFGPKTGTRVLRASSRFQSLEATRQPCWPCALLGFFSVLCFINSLCCFSPVFVACLLCWCGIEVQCLSWFLERQCVFHKNGGALPGTCQNSTVEPATCWDDAWMVNYLQLLGPVRITMPMWLELELWVKDMVNGHRLSHVVLKTSCETLMLQSRSWRCQSHWNPGAGELQWAARWVKGLKDWETRYGTSMKVFVFCRTIVITVFIFMFLLDYHFRGKGLNTGDPESSWSFSKSLLLLLISPCRYLLGSKLPRACIRRRCYARAEEIKGETWGIRWYFTVSTHRCTQLVTGKSCNQIWRQPQLE